MSLRVPDCPRAHRAVWTFISLAAFILLAVRGAAQFKPTPVSVLTQRYNAQRTGANLQEQVLTISSVGNPEFQKLYSIPVNGQVYAQPLLVTGVKFPDGTTKNVLIVATMQNFVSAFEVDDAIGGPAFAPRFLWTLNFGAPLLGNFMPMANSTYNFIFGTAVPNSDHVPNPPWALPPVGISNYDIVSSGACILTNNCLGLYNINPFIGIVSTPVVDPATNMLYVVAKFNGTMGPENDLVKIDIAHGTIVKKVEVGATASVPGSSSDSVNGRLSFEQSHHLQRPALLLQNGVIFVAFGAHQDTQPFHGWVLGFEAGTLELAAVWAATPNGMGAGIWQSGAGIAGDGTNIYVITGNGESDNGTDNSFDVSKKNFANMFVQLNSQLSPIASFPPPDEQFRESTSDGLDLGSSGPVLIPGTKILLGMDKESRMFVLDTSSSMSLKQDIQAGAQLDTISVGGSGFHHIHGSPTLWTGPQGTTAYFWPERDNLRAFVWDDKQQVFHCSADPGGCQQGKTTVPDQISTIQSPTCTGCMPGGVLSISANGNAAGSGILWGSIPFISNGSHGAVVGGALNNVVPGILYAFDAEDVAVVLWNSENNSSRDGSFMFAKFVPPVVANGRVYMPTFGEIPSQPGKQSLTGAINIYGMRQWGTFLGYGIAPPSTVRAGAQFPVQIQMYNAGITTWKKGAVRLTSIFADRLWGEQSQDLPNDVAPGQQVTLNLNLTAPTTIPASAPCTVNNATTITCGMGWVLLDPVTGTFGNPSNAHVLVTGANGPPPKCQVCPPRTKFCGCNDKGVPTCIAPTAQCQ